MLPAHETDRRSDRLDTLVLVLNLIRAGAACTRPELVTTSGLGRAIVAQRVAELLDRGLVVEGRLAPSTGGRAPRRLHLRTTAGYLLVADLGATSMRVGVTDLSGHVLSESDEPADVTLGPDVILRRVEELFDAALADGGVARDKIWGLGIGLPGPVEFASGRPVAPPIMPGWDRYPVRDRLSSRYDAPVWVDNDVNLMALGELRAGRARGVQDVIYVKIGTGIGAGLISHSRLHRGAQGCAGDIGHVCVVDDPQVVCRCGNIGCLEAVAGGAALARDGRAAARDGRSGYLAELLESGQRIEATAVAAAARHGDPVSVQLLARSGRFVGETLARLVNFFNPALILVGGGVASAGDVLLAAIREAVYRRSLPLATRDLQLVRSPLDHRAGPIGAAFMVTDELFSRERLGQWLEAGSPGGRPDLAETALPAHG